jgi:hypothetical protein
MMARAIYSNAIKSRSGDFLTPSPPAEQTTTSSDQAWVACTGWAHAASGFCLCFAASLS